MTEQNDNENDIKFAPELEGIYSLRMGTINIKKFTLDMSSFGV